MQNVEITQLTSTLVEMSVDEIVVAKAARADVQSDWHIGAYVQTRLFGERTMMNVAQIHSSSKLSEVRQRKLVLAMLKSLAESL